MTTTTQLSPSRMIHAALRFLAGVDDGAVSRDDVGFNGRDTTFGQSLAAQHTLSEVQLKAALKMLRTYEHTQLASAGVALPSDAELETEIGKLPVGGSGKRFVRVVDAPLTTDKDAPSTGMVNQPPGVIFKGKTKNSIKVAFKYDPAIVARIKELGGRFDASDKSWTLHIDKMPAVVAAIPGILTHDEVRAMLDKQQSAMSNRLAVMDRLLEVAGDLAAPLPSGRILFKHQQEGVRTLLTFHKQHPSLRGVIVADDMGLGKTTTGLVAARAWQQATGCQIVVIAPISVHGAWRKEFIGAGIEAQIHSWAKLPDVPVSPYVLLADEAHYAQAGSKTTRGKGFLELAEADNCLAVYPLTGTPMRNGKPVNLYPLLKAVASPIAADKAGYEKRYCNAHATQWTRWDVSGASNLNELHTKLKTCMLRRTKAECLDLPAKLRTYRECTIEPKAFKVMQTEMLRMRGEYHERLRAGQIDSEGEALVLLTHLRAGFSIAKIDEAVETAEEVLSEGRSVVVFCDFKVSAIAIADKLKGYGVELLTGDVDQQKRPGMIERFQQGQSRVFVSTIRAGGVGITLTKASELIMVDRTWAPEDNMQAEDRIHRIGQTNQATIINLVACEMDRYLDSLIEKKEAIGKAVIAGNVTPEDEAKMMREVKFSFKRGLEILDQIIGYKG